jgi:hypothetical protein
MGSDRAAGLCTAVSALLALERVSGSHRAGGDFSLAAGVARRRILRRACLSRILQRQFHAATGSIAAAVGLQAIVFGLVHSYQGWKPVLEITVLGVLYGALVALSRDLRASMVAHAWSDIYEGYAKFLWLGRP